MPEVRLYPMAVTSGNTLGNRTGTWRAYRPVYVQLTSPCREACPAGEDIARWIDLLRARDDRQAWEMLTEDNPFPGVMGRICVHPCQSACNRQHHDAPVGINALEQFLGDRALQEGWTFAAPAQERAEHVAVVGGGPAGMSCAYHLRRMGYQVTVYEAAQELGGNLIHALPEHQLPRRVAEEEIRRILDLGVRVRLGVRVGESLSWGDIRAVHQAAFVAVGAPQVPGPGLPGQDLRGVVDGLSFLRAVKAGHHEPPGRQAVVVGAGLTGLEAARALRRLGARAIVVTAEPADRLALPDRVREALAEGVELICGARVEGLSGDGGAVAGVRLADRIVPADAVILATGRTVDLESFPEEVEVDASFHVVADPFTGETNLAGVFAGGDATGTRYAVHAVGAGKRAAAAIHAYLQGAKPAEAMEASRLGYSPNLSMRHYLRPWSYPSQVRVKLQRVVSYDEIETLYFEPLPRAQRRWLPVEARLASFAEARLGLADAEARAESRRCFNCGTCIGCDNCLVFCPDMAIARTDDGAAFEVNLDFCKGCGACVSECPREALVLEEEIK